jgi:hypothetical protein
LGFPTRQSSTRHQAKKLAPLPGIEEEEAPTSTTCQQFFWRCCRGEIGFLQGESLTSIFYFVIVLLYFLASFYQKYKKN